MDIGTGLALLGAKNLVEKLLGPTATYIGEGIKTWTENRVNNVKNIVANAVRRLGPKLEEEGGVPPKILKGILEHGSYCEDSIASEYFGGVLASSRTTIPRDDRGVKINEMLGRLSSYEIRTHYIVYSAIRELFRGSGKSLNIDDRPTLEVFIPISSYEKAMELNEKEVQKFQTILESTFWGLHSEGLLQDFHFGAQAHLKKRSEAADEDGILVTPSILGAQLFLWAHGYGDHKTQDLFQVDLPFDMERQLVIPPGYKKARESK